MHLACAVDVVEVQYKLLWKLLNTRGCTEHHTELEQKTEMRALRSTSSTPKRHMPAHANPRDKFRVNALTNAPLLSKAASVQKKENSDQK